MGGCQSQSSKANDQTLEFSEQDVVASYNFLFENVVKAAASMLELEVISKQLLMPPSEQLIFSLSAVAAVDIISNQMTLLPTEFKFPNHVVTQRSAPLVFRDVVAAMLHLKQQLLKMGNFAALTSAGDIHRIKQQILNLPSADMPMKAWGSVMQKYEEALFAANAVGTSLTKLPQYEAFKTSTIQRVEEMARSATSNTMVTYFYEKDNSDDDDDDDGSPSRPPRNPGRVAHVTSPPKPAPPNTANTNNSATATSSSSTSTTSASAKRSPKLEPAGGGAGSLQVGDFEDDDDV